MNSCSVWTWILVTQSCPTLCNLMDCSPPASSVHGILQASILEWVAMTSSRGSSQHRGQTRVFCTAGRFFTMWTTRKAWRRSKKVKLRKGTGGKSGINEEKQDTEGWQARKLMCSRNWKRDWGASWLAQVRQEGKEGVTRARALRWCSGFMSFSSGQWGGVKVCYMMQQPEKMTLGTSLVVQWLGLRVPNAGDVGLIPGQGTRPHMP